MKTLGIPLLLLLILPIAAIRSLAAPPPRGAGSEFDRLRDKYAELSVKAKKDLKAAEDALTVAYRNGLVRIRDAMKASGDLDGLIQADKEIARFQEEKTIPDTVSLTLPAQIVELRLATSKARDERQMEDLQKTVDLTKMYVSRLDALKKALTKEEKIEEALKVDAEIKRAQFILAEAEPRLPKPTVQPATQPAGDGTVPPPVQPPKPPSLRSNLLKNGDFEDGSLEPWQLGGWGGVMVAEVWNEGPHAGKHAFHFGSQGANDARVLQRLTIPPGDYVLTFWVKVISVANDQSLGLVVNDGEDVLGIKPGDVPAKFKSWQKFTVDCEVKQPVLWAAKPKPGEKPAPNTKVSFQIRGTGELSIDDVTLTRK